MKITLEILLIIVQLIIHKSTLEFDLTEMNFFASTLKLYFESSKVFLQNPGQAPILQDFRIEHGQANLSASENKPSL